MGKGTKSAIPIAFNGHSAQPIVGKVSEQWQLFGTLWEVPFWSAMRIGSRLIKQGIHPELARYVRTNPRPLLLPIRELLCICILIKRWTLITLVLNILQPIPNLTRNGL